MHILQNFPGQRILLIYKDLIRSCKINKLLCPGFASFQIYHPCFWKSFCKGIWKILQVSLQNFQNFSANVVLGNLFKCICRILTEFDHLSGSGSSFSATHFSFAAHMEKWKWAAIKTCKRSLTLTWPKNTKISVVFSKRSFAVLAKKHQQIFSLTVMCKRNVIRMQGMALGFT